MTISTKRFWLMKSEPDTFSIDDLKKKGRAPWDGVRNYQARNFMKEMKVGDQILFYHSSCEIPGVAGLARVTKEAFPDYTSWDKKSDYYDPRSTKEKPMWFMVEVEFVSKLPRLVSLEEIKNTPTLQKMVLLKRGRLSVQPVAKEEFQTIVKLARS